MRIYEEKAPAVVLPVERKRGGWRLLITAHLKIILIVNIVIVDQCVYLDHLGEHGGDCFRQQCPPYENDNSHLNCELKARCEEVMPVPAPPFHRLNILVSIRILVLMMMVITPTCSSQV